MPEYVHTDIDLSVITTSVGYGGPGGQYFRNFDQNDQVSSIQAWVDGSTLRGVVVGYVSGASFAYGSKEGAQTEVFELNGETLTSLTLYDTDYPPYGLRSGGFQFTTSSGRTFAAAATGRPFKVDVGSGKWCGIFGRYGDDIDQLGFAMLR